MYLTFSRWRYHAVERRGHYCPIGRAAHFGPICASRLHTLSPACLSAHSLWLSTLRCETIGRPAPSVITPLLAQGRFHFLSSIALSKRLFRPRASVAYSSRSRRCHSRSRVRLGEKMSDKMCICSYPLLLEHAGTLPHLVCHYILANEGSTRNILWCCLSCGQ